MTEHMSPQYRAIIYVAVATMHFYRKDIVPIREGESYSSFAEKNRAVIDRVCEEVGNLFDYELSSEQLGKAIKAYCAPGQSVSERPAARLD